MEYEGDAKKLMQGKHKKITLLEVRVFQMFLNGLPFSTKWKLQLWNFGISR